MTDIIQRDFFPDVKKLRSQIEPIDSNENGDDLGPIEEDVAHEDRTTLCLDQFLNTYESEDDASFKEMLEKSSEIHQQKYAWLHAKGQEYAKLASAEKNAITGEVHRRAGLDSWTYTAKNALMYIPDGVENSAVQGTSRRREVVHSNTRLSHLFVQKFQHAANSDCVKRPTPQDRVGIDGRTLSIEKSPKVNSYGFLATPKINPGE